MLAFLFQEVGEKSLDTSMVEVKFRQLSCLRMRW